MDKITAAINEVSKSLKAIAFYPEHHPSLKKILKNTCFTIDDIPVPEEGIEVEVAKYELTCRGAKIDEKHAAVPDLRRSLFLRRTKKIIFLPGQEIEDLKKFLKAISLEPEQIVQEGGLENILIQNRVSRIWVNKVDYEKLTEELKKDEESLEMGNEAIDLQDEELDLRDDFLLDNLSFLTSEQVQEEETIDRFLADLSSVSEPGKYRDLVIRISRMINEMGGQQRLKYVEDAIKLYTRHIQYPPGGNDEIKDIAKSGIIEISDDSAIEMYVRKFRMRSLQERVEAEIALSVMGEKATDAILIALTEEKDLIVRKAIVDLVTKIGTSAIPNIVFYLDDERWFVVRNMITILGKMAADDAAPHIAATLQNPDPRVKREAIKALSKIDDPITIVALGECCFLPDDNIARLAITALGTKKDERAVEILYERFLTKKFIYPDINFTRDIVDSLKNIGSDSAVGVLMQISLYNPLIKTKRIKELKRYAIKALGKIKSQIGKNSLEQLSKSSDNICKTMASKILSRDKHEES